MSYEEYEANALRNRRLTGELFHYTAAEVALYNILEEGRLRMAPFAGTNDLWDSRPFQVGVTSDMGEDHEDKFYDSLWEQIDLQIRQHSKVLCLTQDWDLPELFGDESALKGWAHLSLWAHYGGRHSGVCLRFDKAMLIDALKSVEGGHRGSFHGPVTYAGSVSGTITHGIYTGWVREYGVDAVAHEFARLHHDSIFFRKHWDWQNESEYRMVLMSETVMPEYLNIEDALTGVILGESFPQSLMPALRTVMKKYPNAVLEQTGYLNRVLDLWPVDMEEIANEDARQEFEGETFHARLRSLQESGELTKKHGGGPSSARIVDENISETS